MIFLDANAFYSYYGRSKLGMTSEPVDEERLKKYLEQQREKSLPTSVYIEIMTHFRNNPKVLQNLLEFRYAKGLPLFNNIPDYVVSEDEITSVAYMDQAALKNYADRLLKSKIQIESKFTLLFFEITKDLYAHYKLEMTDGLSQKNKDAILGYIGRVAYKEYQNLLEERIKVELQSGYDENKEKKVLKDFYIQELNEACVLTNIIIQGCVACKQDKEDIISIVQQTYQKSIESGLDGNTGTMPCIVDTLATDQHFLDIAKVKVSEMFKKGKYSATQRRYLRDVMFTSWFERGKKLDKNDIFDMLCVGCLDHIDKTKNACVLIDASSYVAGRRTKMVQLVEITGVLNEKGCIEIPIVLLAQTGIRTGEEVNLIYLAAGEKDYRNESREFMLKRAEEDPLEELQSGETELKLPPQLLADAHIPLDADLDIVCLDRKIVILPTEDVESEDVPKELLDICADLGIPREKVNIVLRMTEEENGKK